MALVPFDTLPDDARVWVFGSDSSLDPSASRRLLAGVDAYLTQWNAHGAELTCARGWRDDRFLAIGVDQSSAGASGCSIDGLFRTLRSLEPVLGTSLVNGGRVFFRDESGVVRSVDRERFAQLAGNGAIGEDTPVFDTTVTTAADWRTRFETRVKDSWHKALVD